MKSVHLGLALFSVLALRGETVPVARAAAPALVPSHAYVYLPEQGHWYDPTDVVGVVIQQPGTIAYRECQLQGAQPPTTAAELSALLEGNCAGILHNGFFHQKQGDRYILLDSTSGTGTVGQQNIPAVGSWGSSIVFDPADSGSLKLVTVSVMYPIGQNPVVNTIQETGLKTFDADIDYPQITEKPIEQ